MSFKLTHACFSKGSDGISPKASKSSLSSLLSQLGVNWKIGKFPDADFVLSYKRADLMLEQSRQYGYKILTSTFFEFNRRGLLW